KRFEDTFKKRDSSGRSSQGNQDSKARDSTSDDDDDNWDFLGDLFEDLFSYPFCDHGLRYDLYPFARGRRYFRSDPRVTVGESLHHPESKFALESAGTVGRVE